MTTIYFKKNFASVDIFVLIALDLIDSGIYIPDQFFASQPKNLNRLNLSINRFLIILFVQYGNTSTIIDAITTLMA
jgi:hypothetical protein